MGSMLQVLAVLDSRLDQRGAQCAHVVVHIFIERLVVPCKVETRREDGVRTVRRVRRWSSMCEDVLLERVKAENEQRILIMFDNSVTPGLCRVVSMIH
jgi:hypothetical protein